MKNYQNIGSEDAAKRHAFMHSLAESCRLNSVNIADYFETLFARATSKPGGDGLRGLLPNLYALKY